MRENYTYGLMRGIRRKTAKHVLRVAEGRAGVPDNKGRPALLYTLQFRNLLFIMNSFIPEVAETRCLISMTCFGIGIVASGGSKCREFAIIHPCAFRKAVVK